MRYITFHSEGGRLVANMPPGVTRILAIEPERTVALAALMLHEDDLQRAAAFVDEINNVPTAIAQEGLSEAALGAYFKCFKWMKARTPLQAESVLGKDSTALEVHRYYESVRDKHLVHDENGLSGAVVGAALAPDAPTGPVSEIVCVAYRGQWFDQAAYSNVHLLISRAREFVRNEFERLATALRNELSSEGFIAAQARADLQLAPELENIATTRSNRHRL